LFPPCEGGQQGVVYTFSLSLTSISAGRKNSSYTTLGFAVCPLANVTTNVYNLAIISQFFYSNYIWSEMRKSSLSRHAAVAAGVDDVSKYMRVDASVCSFFIFIVY
jgi:hypothetical protein